MLPLNGSEFIATGVQKRPELIGGKRQHQVSLACGNRYNESFNGPLWGPAQWQSSIRPTLRC